MSAPLQLTAFAAFEACKTARGDEFVTYWRHLLTLDPGHAAAVLLHTDGRNLSGLSRNDWDLAKPHVLALGERVQAPVLARWALHAHGTLFLDIWQSFDHIDAGYAEMVLREHPNPGLDQLTPQEVRPLLSHRSAEVRLAAISHLGRTQQQGDDDEAAPASRPDALARGLHEALRRGGGR